MTTSNYLRCLQCDAIVTGVPESRWEGFAKCAVCQRRSDLAYAADPTMPAVKSPKSKARLAHLADMISMLPKAAGYKVWREMSRKEYADDVWYSYGWMTRGRRCAGEDVA